MSALIPTPACTYSYLYITRCKCGHDKCEVGVKCEASSYEGIVGDVEV